MQFNTKFNVGDKAWTIDLKKMSIVEFTVGRIVVSAEAEETTAVINPVNADGGRIDYYTSYQDKNCFATREALMAELDSNHDETHNK